MHLRATATNQLTKLNYPVVSVEILGDTEAALVEGFGRKWAEKRAFQRLHGAYDPCPLWNR